MRTLSLASPTRHDASLDDIVVIFRKCLPDYGFKLVSPPPFGGAVACATASVWRRGEAQALSHKGATAALALQRAIHSELAKIGDASRHASCSRCHGLGWFVTNSATAEICRH